MATVEIHEPTRFQTHPTAVITASDTDELINDTLSRVRPKSRNVCREQLQHDLRCHGQCLINHHAGNGMYLVARLVKGTTQ